MTTYLDVFEKLVKNGVAYIPVGTLEWHGHQLPIETDFLVAEKLCQIVEKDFPGYILPPLYLATCGKEIIDGKELRGMERKLKKELKGNLFYTEPEFYKRILEALIFNLRQQGFKRIIIVTGHGGENQIGTLEAVVKGKDDVLFLNPYDAAEVHHADEGETSVFWALYPEEEQKSKAQTIPSDDDLAQYRGYSPRDKSSLELGNQLVQKMTEYLKEKIQNFL